MLPEKKKTYIVNGKFVSEEDFIPEPGVPIYPCQMINPFEKQETLLLEDLRQPID